LSNSNQNDNTIISNNIIIKTNRKSESQNKNSKQSDYSFKKKSEDLVKSSISNEMINFNTPIHKSDALKILENIPKIHAFEVPRDKRNENESPARFKKEAFAKNRRNPYLVFYNN